MFGIKMSRNLERTKLMSHMGMRKRGVRVVAGRVHDLEIVIMSVVIVKRHEKVFNM